MIDFKYLICFIVLQFSLSERANQYAITENANISSSFHQSRLISAFKTIEKYLCLMECSLDNGCFSCSFSSSTEDCFLYNNTFNPNEFNAVNNTIVYTKHLDFCTSLVTQGDACTLNCQCLPGLICLSNKCSCTSATYWNGTTCVLKKEYSSTCSGVADECNNARGLYCPISNGTNSCPNNSTYRFCDCPIGQFYDNRTTVGMNTCAPLLPNGASCTMNCQCLVGLICQSNLCSCSSTHFWNGNACAVKKEYSSSCSGFPGECNTAKGLYCSISNGTNSCLNNSLNRVCDCPIGQFYDNRTTIGINACASLLLNGASCTLNCQCNSIAGLTCQSNVCSCSNSTFWSNGTSNCDSGTTLSVCDPGQATFTCLPLRINVLNVFYGCADNRCGTCTACVVNTALTKAKSLCQNKTSCTFKFDGPTFGSGSCGAPPHYGIMTYNCL